jgi:hypothetical protein
MRVSSLLTVVEHIRKEMAETTPFVIQSNGYGIDRTDEEVEIERERLREVSVDNTFIAPLNNTRYGLRAFHYRIGAQDTVLLLDDEDKVVHVSHDRPDPEDCR